jgi:hypothetical protein
MPSVPLFTAQNKESNDTIELSRLGDDLVQINISEDFAGRDVEEELSLEILKKIGAKEPYTCFDLLGLSFETDGQEIKGMVGAGSGVFRFVVKKDDWNSALAQL